MKYLLLGEIQQIIIDHYQKYRQGMDFRDAATRLRIQNKIYTGDPETPDFLTWNVDELDALKPLVAKIPVPLEIVMPLHRNFEPSVHINLEFFNPENFKVMPHIIILYVISGKAVFYTRNETLNLDKGSLLILSPKLEHRIYCTQKDIVVNIISQPELFEDHFSQILKKNELLSTFFHQSLHGQRKEFLRFILSPNKEILHVIKHLFYESVSTEPFATEVFLSYLQILYSHILRNCDTRSNTSIIKQYSHITILPSILLYIQNEYRDLTLSGLAETFNYSSSYLSRLIKKETGKNFNDIIKEHKLDEAKKLLTYTKMSIHIIAEKVGYNSADHFAHSFKESVGLTPSAFRKKYIIQ